MIISLSSNLKKTILHNSNLILQTKPSYYFEPYVGMKYQFFRMITAEKNRNQTQHNEYNYFKQNPT